MSQLLRARRILTEQGWLDDHQLRMALLNKSDFG